MKRKILGLVLVLTMIVSLAVANMSFVGAEEGSSEYDGYVNLEFYKTFTAVTKTVTGIDTDGDEVYDPVYDDFEYTDYELSEQLSSVEVGDVFYVGVRFKGFEELKIFHMVLGYDNSVVQLMDFSADAAAEPVNFDRLSNVSTQMTLNDFDGRYGILIGKQFKSVGIFNPAFAALNKTQAFKPTFNVAWPALVSSDGCFNLLAMVSDVTSSDVPAIEDEAVMIFRFKALKNGKPNFGFVKYEVLEKNPDGSIKTYKGDPNLSDGYAFQAVIGGKENDLNVKLNIGNFAVGVSSDYEVTISDGVITKYKGTDTSVVIPDDINGVTVTGIGASAFEGHTEITDIVIPDTVKSIGDKAFSGCSGLTSITIPDSVTSIGDRAFGLCGGLTSIIVGANNEYYSSEDGNLYNKDKTILMQYATGKKDTHFDIPSSVTSIDASAFYGCTGLTSINVDENNEYYSSEDGNLYNKDKTILLQYATGKKDTYFDIPNSVTSVSSYAFYNCNELTSITVPDSVTSIGEYAFELCTGLTTVCYNGNQTDWSKISIGSGNDYLKNAERRYFYYVTLFDKEGTQISKKMYDIDATVDISDIEMPEDFKAFLYTDKELGSLYDEKTKINQNTTLHVDFIKFNAIEFSGETSVDIGEKGITKKAFFMTDKDAKYLSCTLKVPRKLAVRDIKSEAFEIDKLSEVIGDDTYYYLFCTYNGDVNIPKNQRIIPFELIIDVSENTEANEILAIEISEDAVLADDNGNSYGFESIGKTEIKINPILITSIEISGADVIEEPTAYTVSVLPENATNKEMTWTVSDEEVATISQDGILTPIKKGVVTIRATAKDGSEIFAEKEVTVKVYADVTSILSNIGIWDKEYNPLNKSYTIYVSESATIIRLTAKHNGTLKTEDGKITFLNGVGRAVSILTDETVLTLKYVREGYDDNTYIITIKKTGGTKTTVSEDEKTFTVTPFNIETGKTVILALYDGDKFVEMQSAACESESLTFITDKVYTNAKVMVWDSFESLKSVCSPEKLD